MHATVFMFARLREMIGADRVVLDWPSPATVSDLRQALLKRYPQAAELLQRSAIAVNNHYATDHEFVRGTDELAVIPPVSGGAERATPTE